MKTLAFSLLLLLSAMPFLPAQSAEDVAGQLATHLENENWEGAAELMHPESLQRFRETLSPVLSEAAHPIVTEIRLKIFGSNITDEQISLLSDQEFVSQCLAGLNDYAAEAGFEVDIQSMDVLGVVEESATLHHVVVRSKLNVGKFATEYVEVLPMEQTDGKWRAMLLGKFHGISRGIDTLIHPDTETTAPTEATDDPAPAPTTITPGDQT